MKIRYRLLILAALMLLSTGCDQATKQVATATLKYSPGHSFLGDLFRLQYSENPGAFLSLGADLPNDARAGVFMVGVGVLLLAVLAFALFARGLRPASIAALGLFLGGGVSNWADRLVHGNLVVDFMNVGVGPVRSGIFNVADLCIVGGAVLLFSSELLSNHAPATAVAPAVSPDEEAVITQQEWRGEESGETQPIEESPAGEALSRANYEDHDS